MRNAHPEQRDDEHWCGNTRVDEWPKPGFPELPTARLGEIAYDIDGKKIDPKYMRPLFMGEADYQVYNREQERRLSAIRNS